METITISFYDVYTIHLISLKDIKGERIKFFLEGRGKKVGVLDDDNDYVHAMMMIKTYPVIHNPPPCKII